MHAAFAAAGAVLEAARATLGLVAKARPGRWSCGTARISVQWSASTRTQARTAAGVGGGGGMMYTESCRVAFLC